MSQYETDYIDGCYNCVCGQGGEEIKLDENVRVKAKACIDYYVDELGE